MTLISVVIQNYNYGHFLPDAIESILNQDFPHDEMELIIIDDASTDGISQKLIKNYEKKHPCIRAIFYEKNRGTHASANHGIELARGSIFIYLLQMILEIACF